MQSVGCSARPRVRDVALHIEGHVRTMLNRGVAQYAMSFILKLRPVALKSGSSKLLLFATANSQHSRSN